MAVDGLADSPVVQRPNLGRTEAEDLASTSSVSRHSAGAAPAMPCTSSQPSDNAA